MPGPYGTLILDDFNRSDSATLGAAWTADIAGLGFHPSLSIVSNQCAHGAGDFENNSYNTQYAANQEVFATLATLPNGNGATLIARLTLSGTTSTFYEMNFVSGANYVSLRVDNCTAGARAETVLEDSGVVCAAGNRIALSCIGDQIEMWRDTGGGWVQIGGVTDATYSGSSTRLGIWMQNTTALVLDDFGGGSITAANPLPPNIASPVRW